MWTKDPEAERKAYERYDKFLQDPKAYWEDRLSELSFTLGASQLEMAPMVFNQIL
ncbi:MAG: hypothetical protein ACOC6S_02535 [Chloroflexota bacterium]